MKDDALANWEARIIHAGIRILTILTFLAFMVWALSHLVMMFA